MIRSGITWRERLGVLIFAGAQFMGLWITVFLGLWVALLVVIPNALVFALTLRSKWVTA